MKLTVLAAYHAGKLYLPPGYQIRLDADLLTLHCDDGSMVASFVVGAAPSEVVREAEKIIVRLVKRLYKVCLSA
jgi:hypothetical protein